MHAHIPIEKLIPAGTACDRINHIVQNCVCVALEVQIYHESTDPQCPFVDLFSKASPVPVTNVLCLDGPSSLFSGGGEVQGPSP